MAVSQFMSKLFAMTVGLFLLGALFFVASFAVSIASKVARGDWTNRGGQVVGNDAFRISRWSLLARALFMVCPRCGLDSIFEPRFKPRRLCRGCGALFSTGIHEWYGLLILDYTAGMMAGLLVWMLMRMADEGSQAKTALVGLSIIFTMILALPSAWSFWKMFLFSNGSLAIDDPTHCAPLVRAERSASTEQQRAS